MKTLNPDTTRRVLPSEALLIPLYRCLFCGDSVEVRHVTLDEASKWKGGELIQNVWPHMDADTRECIIMRACRECYEEHVAPIYDTPTDVCEWCGGPATEDDPITTTQVSPPVNGHSPEFAELHRACAAEMARQSVI